MTNLIFLVAWALSMGVGVLIVVALALFIRKSWRELQSDADGSIHRQILDEVESLRIQMEILQDRMSKLAESSLPPAGDDDGGLSPSSRGEPPDGTA